MSKGKKFSAAEKHFQEKEIKLRKEVEYWKCQNIEQAKRAKQLEQELEEAKSTIQSQSDWIERLLQYTELSLEDIKKACEKDKRMAEVAGMMFGVSKFLGL